ncbi:MAG: DUF177 domain-containing protein [Deltaproteobacteria bacterium]|nr:DUF177 domain-containing protein [Deltaproteobacteria bacterium]
MKVQVSRISDEGFFQNFSDKDPWAKKKFEEAFQEHWKKGEPLQGFLKIQKTGANLSFTGELTLDYHGTCDRCLVPFVIPMKVQSQRWMAPLKESQRQRDIEASEDVELSAEDVNFSFYKSNEIDLGEMLVEQTFLDLPMVFLCQPACKGLCKVCGGNLNEKDCQCEEKQRMKESPFRILGKLDVKR